MQFYMIDEKLEAAIDKTDMSAVRKSTYKNILEFKNGILCVKKIALELMPDFVRNEDIIKIKNELRRDENVTQS